jgi:hypothetical protein
MERTQLPELRPVDHPQDHDIATPEDYRDAIRKASQDRRMTREKTDKVLTVLRSWVKLPGHSGTAQQIGASSKMSPSQVQLILSGFGGLIAEKLTAINGYCHGVHPNGEAFPWSTTAFAAKLDGEKGPSTWTMRRNFIAGIRLLNGWLPQESVENVESVESVEGV